MLIRLPSACYGRTAERFPANSSPICCVLCTHLGSIRDLWYMTFIGPTAMPSFSVFQSCNLNFHGKQWCINTLSLKRRNISKCKDCFFKLENSEKSVVFSMDTTFDRDSLKIFTSFHIFTRGKRKMGLFWTESVLIFKIRKREPLFFRFENC